MEVCNKDQAQEYRDEYGSLAQRHETSHGPAVPSPQAYKTLAELGLDSLGGDQYAFGCAD